MNNIQKSRSVAIATAALFALLLSSCSVERDLQLANTCGQPIDMAVDVFGSTNWYSLAEGEQVTIGAGGTSEIRVSLNPADQRDAPFVEIDVDELDWVDKGNGIDITTFQFDKFGLCP